MAKAAPNENTDAVTRAAVIVRTVSTLAATTRAFLVFEMGATTRPPLFTFSVDALAVFMGSGISLAFTPGLVIEDIFFSFRDYVNKVGHHCKFNN
jgi:hypothetical protein